MKRTIRLIEKDLTVSGIPSKYQFMVKDFYRGGDGYWVIELKDGYDDECGNNYIWEKSRKRALEVLRNIYLYYKDESK